MTIDQIKRIPGYIYKISFSSGHYYYGSKKGSPESTTNYYGSPKTNKHYWDENPILCKEVLMIFEDYDNSFILEFESRLIKNFWKDPLCLNAGCGTAIIQTSATKKKRKQTWLKKYGVEHHSQRSNFQEQIKQTNNERYGYDYYNQSPEAKERVKQTCIDRYGFENPAQSEAIKTKKRQTCIDRYGVENPSQLQAFKEKRKQTWLENYGVEHPSQIPGVRDKWKHPGAKKELWLLADQAYKIWQEKNCGYVNLAKEMGFKRSRTFQNFVTFFRDGWIPNEDKEWLKWRNENA